MPQMFKQNCKWRLFCFFAFKMHSFKEYYASQNKSLKMMSLSYRIGKETFRGGGGIKKIGIIYTPLYLFWITFIPNKLCFVSGCFAFSTSLVFG